MSGSKIRLYGSTSGYVELAAPAVADDAVLTLPPTFSGIGSNVVSARPTAPFSTTSTTYQPVTGATVTITPTSSSSKILVMAGAGMSISANGVDGDLRLMRDSTPVGNSTVGYFGQAREINSTLTQVFPTIVFVDSPATTSATTYSLEAKLSGSGPTLHIGGRSFDGSPSTLYIVAIEVAA